MVYWNETYCNVVIVGRLTPDPGLRGPERRDLPNTRPTPKLVAIGGQTATKVGSCVTRQHGRAANCPTPEPWDHSTTGTETSESVMIDDVSSSLASQLSSFKPDANQTWRLLKRAWVEVLRDRLGTGTDAQEEPNQ